MKRQVVLLLAAAMVLACSACGKGAGPAQPEAPPPFVSQPAQAEPSAKSEAPVEEPQPTKGEEARGDGPAAPDAGSGPKERETGTPAGDPQPESPRTKAVSIDVDLTALSSTMVYAEVFNMMMSPDDYIGKVIRMTGIFTVYQDPETNQVYCGVIVEDATACCAQGFELVMPEGLSYPRDYPNPISEVTVVGTLQADRTLEEHGIIVLRLEEVTFESADDAP